jgi:type IV pilus biogenesis protein PilP
MTSASHKDRIRFHLIPALLLPVLIASPGPLFAQAQDPITTESADLLDGSGLIARQSRLGEGIIILDRQLRHAEAVEKLIRLLGPDAKIEVSPGEFVDFADTPAGLRARLEIMRLQQEIAQMLEPKPAPVAAQPPRSDGSEIIDLIDRRITELTEQAEAPATEPARDGAQILLREISGVGSELTAVLQYGSDRVRVRSGDALPGGVQIISVDRDGVSLTRRGLEMRLTMAN